MFVQQPVLALHIPLHSVCPVGHAQVPVWQVSPPVQLALVQQLVDGMHVVPQSWLPAGHAHAPASPHVRPPPHPASAQQARPSAPHVPLPPSDASVDAVSLAASPAESTRASEPMTASPTVASCGELASPPSAVPSGQTAFSVQLGGLQAESDVPLHAANATQTSAASRVLPVMPL